MEKWGGIQDRWAVPAGHPQLRGWVRDHYFISLDSPLGQTLPENKFWDLLTYCVVDCIILSNQMFILHGQELCSLTNGWTTVKMSFPAENLPFRKSACKYWVISKKTIANNVNNWKISNQDIQMSGIAVPRDGDSRTTGCCYLARKMILFFFHQSLCLTNRHSWYCY